MNHAAHGTERRLPNLRVGSVVEILSAQEILATLDESAELACLPFMPEMLKFCGQRMTVHKVAHKLCDTTSGHGGLRWLNDAVHLKGARCDGSAHGGCQTACLLYWKAAWLRHVQPDDDSPATTAQTARADGAEVDLSRIHNATRKEPAEDEGERYACQATEILRAAPSRIRFLHFDQYFADVKTGNATLSQVVRTFLIHLFNVYQRCSKRVLPRRLLIKEGLAWGFVKGRAAGKTPTGRLDLRVGDVVRIKSKDEITQTLDAKRLNRGLGFEEEMARFCGRTARVRSRVDRCIDEKTGKMLVMKNPCIVLEGIACEGAYKGNCPREYVSFWREIWLERVGPDQLSSN